MNQILYVQEKRKSNPEDTKKIVLFFAIAIIVFGVILLGQGIYGVYQKMKNDRPDGIQVEEKAQIQLLKQETGEILITVESNEIISELIYNWNSDASQTISGNGRTSIQETIEMPAGQNTLTVKTIDVNGKESKVQETFTLEVDKPEITLSVINNKIKIIVNSNADLSYITYKWNSDEENKIDMLTYEDKTKLEREIDILEGQNTLTIVAVDIYGNKSEKTQEIKGVTPENDAEINPIGRGENIYFDVSAEKNIEEIEFTLNGTVYKLEQSEIGETNKYTYTGNAMKMVVGKNYLKIKVTTETGKITQRVYVKEYPGPN